MLLLVFSPLTCPSPRNIRINAPRNAVGTRSNCAHGPREGAARARLTVIAIKVRGVRARIPRIFLAAARRRRPRVSPMDVLGHSMAVAVIAHKPSRVTFR